MIGAAEIAEWCAAAVLVGTLYHLVGATAAGIAAGVYVAIVLFSISIQLQRQ